jgi:peptidoglycan L-alanyl-D-glutamate endopeptidase CwlK
MNSKHLPQTDGYAHAVDVAPLISGNIPWKNWEAFKRMSEAVFKAADFLGYHVVWGGNWPVKKLDGPHFQI